MAQSPLISIPKKRTDDVDWTGPIRSVISQSYGELPDAYASECASLQRCRQDAVKGAGSDMTARDLLYKYFGQLELLELRFSEIRVSFPWYDAFTSKLTTQTSLAFEKASIIFQIAATHSTIATTQNRSDPEGLKRAFHYFKTAAGMLTYINENFLHAPSTDLSKEVIKFLVAIMLAQATEVFLEKLIIEKGGNSAMHGFVSKVASQATTLYTNLTEDVKEFMGKGIFDRNWVSLLQIKAKYLSSLAQYYRSLADSATGNHGEALARLVLAESTAKEAHRLSQTFSSYFVSTLSPDLPADSGSAILELTKNHLAVATEKRAEAQRENDLIYHAVPVPEGTLAQIDKVSVATMIPIQEVYGTPDVQKLIGPDIFAKLIPLSVHEAASVYSEEKAKLVRAEVEKAEVTDSEARAALESLGLPSGLNKWKQLTGGEEETGVPKEVDAWATEVSQGGGAATIEKSLTELERLKRSVDEDLNQISADLDTESRECEAMRVKYGHLWEQEPSASLSRPLRTDLKSHRDAFTAASSSDSQVLDLWGSVRADLGILFAGSDALEGYFISATTEPDGQSLLDTPEDFMDEDQAVLDEIRKRVVEIDDKIGRINKVKRERAEVLRDLKEKIHNDDVSHLLLLNRRASGSNVEPNMFTNELEKFRPYQNRLAATIQVQSALVDDISKLYKQLTTNVKGKESLKKADLKDRKRAEAIARLSRCRDGWVETKEALSKGLQFYRELATLATGLRRNTSSFVNTRASERAKLVAKAEAAQSKPDTTPSGPPPPPPPKTRATGVGELERSFGGLGLGTPASASPPVPPQPWQSPPLPTPPTRQPSYGYTSPLSPPPPPPPSAQSYPSPVPPLPAPVQHQAYNSFSIPPPTSQSQPPAPNRHPSLPPPPSQLSQYGGTNLPQRDPYADLFDMPGLSSQFQSGQQAPPPPPPQPQRQMTTPYTPSPQPPSGYYPSQPPYANQYTQQQPQQQQSYQSYQQPPPNPMHQQAHPPQAPYGTPYSPPPPQQQQYPPPPPQQSYGYQQQQPQYGNPY